jgi:D-lyxose ketol-isomerase
MITRSEQKKAQEKALALYEQAGMVLTEEEKQAVEVVDFGLSRLEIEGAQILTMVQTERISVKLLALMPFQTEPEHWHPPYRDDPGKEETIRHVWGDLYFYLPGEGKILHGAVPEGKDEVYTCRREFVLQPGEQLTSPPGEKHWFQAGPRGAVLFSFSTIARDAQDKFTDPQVNRITQIKEE